MSQLLPPDPELINAGETFATDRHTAGDPGAKDWCSTIDFGRYMELRAVYGKPHEQAKREVQTWLRTQLPNLPALPPWTPVGNEDGRLHIDRYDVIDARGQAWLYAGFDSFVGPKRFADSGSVSWLDEPISLGGNTAILFGMFGGPGWSEQYTPDTDPDFYKRLPDLIGAVSVRRCRTEYVVFTGAWLMPDKHRQQEHFARVCDILRPFPLVILRLANEENGIDFREFKKPDGILSTVGQSNNGASGQPSFGIPPLPGWDLHCYETARDDLERSLRDAGGGMRELVRGWAGFNGTQGPTYIGEPIGFAESLQPGRRSNDPRYALCLAANAAVNSLGAAFHSDDGLNCRPFGLRTRECAEAFFRGLYAGFVR